MMEFRNYNVGGSQADSNFTKHSADLYGECAGHQDTQEYNKESEERIKVNQTESGKTYCAASKSIETTRVFTPSGNALYANNKVNMRGNIQYNWNKAEISENYQLAYIPCSSKERNISNYHNQTAFRRFENEGARTLCEGNYSTEYDPNKYTEKSTYCRALFNNQEFVHKTLAKNARLQRIVKKLVGVRQKQKDEDSWNNFINELKNKHGNSFSENKSPQIPEEIPERIEDFYKNESDPCRSLLKDFYTIHNNLNRSLQYKTRTNSYPRQENYGQYVFENQCLCYPTSSQGRLMMLNSQRQQNQFANGRMHHPQHSNFRGNVIFADRDFDKRKNQTFRRLQPTKFTNTIDSQSETVGKIINNKSMQTDFRCLFPISEYGKNDSKANSTKERYKMVAKNVERLKRKLQKSNTDIKQNALDNIENKLNNLIQTLNTFMVDIKANSPFSRDSKSNSVSTRVKDNSLNELNAAKSDTYNVIKREGAICRAAHENPSATSAFLNAAPSTKCAKEKYMKIDKILNEEMDKSNKVKRDLEDIIYQRSHRPRAVQITFDMPTKERSTEVTNSLSKAKVQEVIVEKVENSMVESDAKRMTIAVNTDPLGILGLLRISSEVVKQILSYMPHIDYYSYLSMLQFPQPRHSDPHYICNICGASFERPSQLSDHIQTHNLGYSRDCCVCRHVLDMKRRRPGLFKCEHCGQIFTRAYCCKLHEETCARRLGVPRDVNSTLNLLQ